MAYLFLEYLKCFYLDDKHFGNASGILRVQVEFRLLLAKITRLVGPFGLPGFCKAVNNS